MAGPKPAVRDIHGKLATAPAKEAVLDLLARGSSIAAAARQVGRTAEGVKWWRDQDPEFDARVRLIITRRKETVRPECPDFEEFCEQFLMQPLWWHQLQWYDVLEGREPRDLHPAERYSKGDPQMLLVNTPPGHAKSTVLTTNYVTWRICRDPNIRVIIVSATEKLAKKFLYAIKQRLSNPAYGMLQQNFGPQGGFLATAESWTATEIYLGGKDDGEKDPTVQAIGMGGQIYGSRADLIVVDDAVLLKNAHQWEDQLEWLTQEVVTRLPEGDPDAKLIVAGTRVAPVDLYQKLRDEFRTEDDNPVFTYFSQPAVLEYRDTPEEWVTLWPNTHDRNGNIVPKWNGKNLASRRQKLRPWTWTMVYQQEDASTDGIFNHLLVQAASDTRRKPGVLVPGEFRPDGMRGLHIVMGMDPATSGFTAAICIGVDRRNKKIWLIDAFNRAGVSATEKRKLMETWVERYGVNEIRIEENAFQKHMLQDNDLRAWMFQRGVLLKGHHTGRNKNDAELGVAAMSVLFEPDKDGLPTLLLPNNHAAYPAVSRLCEQLIAWQPGVKASAGQTDLVMALWFCALRAWQLLHGDVTKQNNYNHNPMLNSNRARRERMVVNLTEIEQEMSRERLLRG